MPGRRPRPLIRALTVGAVLTCAISAVVTTSAIGPVAAAGSTASFVATSPCRLADQRDGTNVVRLDAQIVRVEVRGRCGVPADATAVALTVTVDSSLTQGPGYISVWPEGQPVPTASIINYFQGQVRANGAIVGLQAPGTIAVLSSNGAPVVVDVTGWFVPASSARAGRFVPITPTRAVDTRLAPRQAPLAAGETITVPLPPDVPTDASAVALTVTLTEATGPGYFTVSPAGSPAPSTSIVNADAARQTRAAGSIVAVSPAGLDVYSRSGGHVLIDITGWFTGTSAADDDDGLFVAADAPRRLVDTRSGNPVWAGGTIEIPNVDPNAAALAVNVALVNPMRATYLTAHAAREPLPVASSVNATSSSEIAASMAIAPVSAAGLAVYSSGGSDAIVDLAGWFTGTPAAGAGSAPLNRRPPECARSTEPNDLTTLFARNAMFSGADYQRPFPLPDGRVLWLFQDMYITGRYGQATFVHNAGLVQSGGCFELLHTGDYARPAELVMADATQRRQRWFWPLAGEMGDDGLFHLFVAELRERGASYLTKVEPVATWKVAIDLTTLRVVDTRPAVNPSAALYGWSVASDDQYTYLYAHCYRQFGWSAFPFVSPPVYIHDLDCSDEVRVARTTKGRFDQPLQYWDGNAWQADPSRAVSVVPTGRMVSASQFYRDGNRWISITKVGDWFGDQMVIDIATRPQGPYTTVRTFRIPEKCGECNTYFPALLPWRSWNGAWLLAISNNRFDRLDLSQYQPSFFAIDPV
jgi:hypothetical protein